MAFAQYWSCTNAEPWSEIIVSLLHEDNVMFHCHPQIAHCKEELLLELPNFFLHPQVQRMCCLPFGNGKRTYSNIHTTISPKPFLPVCKLASTGLLDQSSDIKKVFPRWTVSEVECLYWGSSRLRPWEGLAGSSRIVPHWVNPRQANAVLPTERFQWFQKARWVDSFGSVLSFL